MDFFLLSYLFFKQPQNFDEVPNMMPSLPVDPDGEQSMTPLDSHPEGVDGKLIHLQ